MNRGAQAVLLFWGMLVAYAALVGLMVWVAEHFGVTIAVGGFLLLTVGGVSVHLYKENNR